MKGIITQSNYIPWKGYFDNIAQCNVMVVYDDMQYTKRDWRNRNYIKTPQGLKWLSIPVEVSGKYLQKINETKISNHEWNKEHWAMLKQYYRDAPYFSEFATWVEGLYNDAIFTTLTEINVHFLKAVCKFLEIETQFIDSRQFTLVEGKTERLVDICKKCGITNYYSGPAAKNYMDENLFLIENITVHYADYSGYKEYPQLFPPFEHGVCIWDLIFNVGNNSKKYLKYIV
jgi:hypothetical protein